MRWNRPQFLLKNRTEKSDVSQLPHHGAIEDGMLKPAAVQRGDSQDIVFLAAMG
jgi:hypothetical protein